jgi:hypothetical protein
MLQCDLHQVSPIDETLFLAGIHLHTFNKLYNFHGPGNIFSRPQWVVIALFPYHKFATPPYCKLLKHRTENYQHSDDPVGMMSVHIFMNSGQLMLTALTDVQQLVQGGTPCRLHSYLRYRVPKKIYSSKTTRRYIYYCLFTCDAIWRASYVYA